MAGKEKILHVNDNATIQELGSMVEDLMKADKGRYFGQSVNPKGSQDKKETILHVNENATLQEINETWEKLKKANQEKSKGGGADNGEPERLP